jgi:hypothetical protein
VKVPPPDTRVGVGRGDRQKTWAPGHPVAPQGFAGWWVGSSLTSVGGPLQLEVGIGKDCLYEQLVVPRGLAAKEGGPLGAKGSGRGH